jgi:aldehyde dehydrogenase (NAD+)
MSHADDLELHVARELSNEVRTRFLLGGAWEESSSNKRVAVVHPASEQTLIEVPLASARDIERAILAARQAFDSGPWSTSRPAVRAATIARLAEAVGKRAELFARLWTAQVGAPITLTRQLASEGVRRLVYFASLAASFEFESSRPTAGGSARVRREPAGVAVLIVPWSASFPILCNKLGAALAAGCTCIVKPSPYSPLDALVVAECAREAGLPPGVCNVINAGSAESAQLVASAAVDTVSFTGSLAVGRAVASACAQNITRLTLELGGKSAAVLLAELDLPQALQALMPFTMPFSGQSCFANSRILVARERLEETVTLLKSMLERMTMGNPWQPETEVGPVLNGRQANRVLSYIDSGRREGAELVSGGQLSDRFARGYYIEPTLFASVHSGMAIARHEIFGPVITVEGFDTEEEAVRMVNAPGLGLSGSVFARDPERAYAVACQLRTGQVGINHLELSPSVPFGGFKFAGLGREGGPEGLEAFLETKAIFMPFDRGGSDDARAR